MLFFLIQNIFRDCKNMKMQTLVYILKGQKKKQTGKVYYFHEGEHLDKVACVVKIKLFFMDWFYYNLIILIK